MTGLAVGVSHRSAPVGVLDRVALDRPAVTKLLDDVRGSSHLSEAVVVATCNRLELYADVATFHGGVEEASSLLAQHTGMPRDELTSYLYVYYDERAVAHLFRVAGGLDSMVVGETQILGQVRDAYRLAQTSGATGRVLSELFQAALRVGKRVHAETGIDAAGRSLVSLALAQVLPAVRPHQTDGASPAGTRAVTSAGSSWRRLVPGVRALVVGAGSMAALAATTLRREGAELTVANRTWSKASQLASSVDGTAVPMDRVADALAEVDLVVSCTGAAGVVLPADTVDAAMRARAGRVLGMVDLAVPHDVDRAVAELPGVILVDLERLSTAPTADLNPGRSIDADLAAARDIVTGEVADFLARRRAALVAPTVVALRDMASDVVDAELARLGGRLPGLDSHVREELAATVRRVVDKLLHAPIVRVKELANQPNGASYEQALRQLFALDPRSVDAVTGSATAESHGVIEP